jgi:hypothetical protein
MGKYYKANAKLKREKPGETKLPTRTKASQADIDEANFPHN